LTQWRPSGGHQGFGNRSGPSRSFGQHSGAVDNPGRSRLATCTSANRPLAVSGYVHVDGGANRLCIEVETDLAFDSRPDADGATRSTTASLGASRRVEAGGDVVAQVIGAASSEGNDLSDRVLERDPVGVMHACGMRRSPEPLATQGDRGGRSIFERSMTALRRGAADLRRLDLCVPPAGRSRCFPFWPALALGVEPGSRRSRAVVRPAGAGLLKEGGHFCGT